MSMRTRSNKEKRFLCVLDGDCIVWDPNILAGKVLYSYAPLCRHGLPSLHQIAPLVPQLGRSLPGTRVTDRTRGSHAVLFVDTG